MSQSYTDSEHKKGVKLHHACKDLNTYMHAYVYNKFGKKDVCISFEYD